MREHDVALVTFEMLVQPHAVAALAQDARQRCLAHLKRPAGAGARVGRADLNNVLEKDMIRGTRWISLTWLGSMLLLAGSLYIIAMSPSGDKWDRAIAVKVCGGLAIVRLENGTLWLVRGGWNRRYQIENLEKLEVADESQRTRRAIAGSSSRR